MDDAELVNKPLEAWTKWALVWLTVFPFVGILVSIRFHNREFLGGMPLFTFGRLCSVHLGGVLFGPFTSALIALFYYCSAVRHAAVLLPYGPVNGVNSAAIHGLCMHNLVGLWITPARLATIYYFLTLSAKNMPIQGARWHPVWHGTEAMMVQGGLLIRSRSHSSR